MLRLHIKYEYRLYRNQNVGGIYIGIQILKVEDLVDEMLAILSDRAQIIEKKESEHAQAVISEMYRKGIISDEELGDKITMEQYYYNI